MEAAMMIGIVDDDEAVRESLRFLLEVAGHDVETFSSAAEFLAVEVTRFAGLILDQHMPHMTGLKLAARLREAGYDRPIVLITGMPSAAIDNRAADVGIGWVLEKPFQEAELFSFFDEVVAHR